MPVTNVFQRFPTSPLIEEYRSLGGVFNATIFRVGHFFAPLGDCAANGVSGPTRRAEVRRDGHRE